MIVIDNVLIDESIIRANFSCDLKKCHGACCTFPGDFGAPLKDEELALIEQAAPFAMEYLSDKAKKTIAKNGIYEGRPGKYTTNCINKKDCVFVYYDGKIALCALEKAYMDGKTEFRKPISCHLFPIRVGNFGGEYLYYEKIDECEPGRDMGSRERITLCNSLKDSLTRAYGEEWFLKLVDAVQENR